MDIGTTIITIVIWLFVSSATCILTLLALNLVWHNEKEQPKHTKLYKSIVVLGWVIIAICILFNPILWIICIKLRKSILNEETQQRKEV